MVALQHQERAQPLRREHKRARAAARYLGRLGCPAQSSAQLTLLLRWLRRQVPIASRLMSEKAN